MARGWSWGEMVRARMWAERLLTADELALRRRVAAAVIIGLALGAGLQLSWPGFMPAIGGFAVQLALDLWHAAVLIASVCLVWYGLWLLAGVAARAISGSPRHG